MICLNAVIENGNNNAFSCIPFLPCWCYIHVETIFGAAILQKQNRRKRKRYYIVTEQKIHRHSATATDTWHTYKELLAHRKRRSKKGRKESNQKWRWLIIPWAMNCWMLTVYTQTWEIYGTHTPTQRRRRRLRYIWWEMESECSVIVLSIFVYQWHLFYCEFPLRCLLHKHTSHTALSFTNLGNSKCQFFIPFVRHFCVYLRNVFIA